MPKKDPDTHYALRLRGFPMSVKFGTDGWRAVISDTFTFANLRLVAQAIADYIAKKTVVIQLL